jgi:hypothetical protein
MIHAIVWNPDVFTQNVMSDLVRQGMPQEPTIVWSHVSQPAQLVADKNPLTADAQPEDIPPREIG